MNSAVLTSGRGSHYWLSWSSHMLHMWRAHTWNAETSPFQLGLSSFQTSHSHSHSLSDENNLFRTSAPCLQLNHRNSEELNCLSRNLSQSRHRVLNIQGKILQTLKLDERVGFQCLGQSNWTNCSLLSLFCPKIFTTFPLSYWRAHSYSPRRPIIRKGNYRNSKIGWDWGVSVPGAIKLDHLQPAKPLLSQNF